VIPTAAGVKMEDDGDDQWHFYSFGEDRNSEIYYEPQYENTRYIEVEEREPEPEPDIADDESLEDYSTRLSDRSDVIKYEKMLPADGLDYTQLKEDTLTRLIRVDLSDAAGSGRSNCFAKCLTGNYISSGGAIYKIVGSPKANVIDVEIDAVNSNSVFDPQTDSEYEIINHYAWMVVDHLDGFRADNGAFKGIVDRIEDSTIIINAQGFNNSSAKRPVFLNNLYPSYTDRYAGDPSLIGKDAENVAQNDVSSSGEINYNNYENWKLMVNKADATGDTVFDIEAAEFPPVTAAPNDVTAAPSHVL